MRVAAYFLKIKNDQSRVHGIPLPEPITYGGVTFDRMIGKASAQSVWLPALVTWGTAVAVSLIPALRAARLRPVEAMRMH